MAFQSDTDRYGDRRGPADPALDPALRGTEYARTRPGSTLWIVAGIVVLLGVLAIWSGMFDRGTTVTSTATPPAVEAPAPAPQPAPAPAQ